LTANSVDAVSRKAAIGILKGGKSRQFVLVELRAKIRRHRATTVSAGGHIEIDEMKVQLWQTSFAHGDGQWRRLPKPSSR
jgi:hypothetical protein